MWPDDFEDFVGLVGQAMKRTGQSAESMRDRLADAGVVDRTVEALETIVERIDSHLEVPVDDVLLSRRQKARDRMYEALVWYRACAAMGDAGG